MPIHFILWKDHTTILQSIFLLIDHKQKWKEAESEKGKEIGKTAQGKMVPISIGENEAEKTKGDQENESIKAATSKKEREYDESLRNYGSEIKTGR